MREREGGIERKREIQEGGREILGREEDERGRKRD